MSLQVKQVEARANAMRHHVIVQTQAAKSGHPGGSLSAADIMAVLYFTDVMQVDKDRLDDPMRDRFVLAKGHAAPILYAALCELGVVSPEELTTLRKLGSRLQGHPDCRKLPGVEASTGSLGQGLSIACGMALGLQHTYPSNTPHVFALLGDGELQEGSNWEALMFAASQCLNNLVAIVDVNHLQIDGCVDDVVSLGDLQAKFTAFGWHVLTCNGHEVTEVYEQLSAARAYQEGPVVLLAQTIKGRGVSFMEDNCGWHGKAPNDQQAQEALAELDAAKGAC